MRRSERRLASSKGGFVTAARYDPKKYTKAAHEGLRAKFRREVDPDNQLSIAERERRATAAFNAHMVDLARKAVKARREKGAARRRAK
jgi:hypothetical protein